MASRAGPRRRPPACPGTRSLAGPAPPPGPSPGLRRGGAAQRDARTEVLRFASLIVSLLAASSALTPLYAIYQQSWGFSPITTTIVFGVYALAVLASLLTLGRLSDYAGRRPVILAALAVQVVSMAVFATAGGVGELLVARIIQGLSTGAAIGAIGAAMLDIDRERGTLANAISPGLGTGSGALLSALFVQYLPAPTHLDPTLGAHIGVIGLQAAGGGRAAAGDRDQGAAFRLPRWCPRSACLGPSAALCWPPPPSCSPSGPSPACTARSARPSSAR